MTITTTANQVKAGGFWCEDATSQTEDFLKKHNATWDTEFPVAAGLDGLGLANTLLALGSPLPRHKIAAQVVLGRYLKELAQHIIGDQAYSLQQYDFKKAEPWLFNPNRKAARMHMLAELKLSRKHAVMAYEENMLDAMCVLLSDEKPHLMAIQAGKYYFAAVGIETICSLSKVDFFKSFLRDALSKYDN